jgi:hypothetical protein
MTLIWITLAFLAGALFWHQFGGWLFKRFGLSEAWRADLVRNLNTDTLAALYISANKELQRRQKVTEETRA